MKQMNPLANELGNSNKAGEKRNNAPASAMLNQAEALLRSRASLSVADEDVLFRALRHYGGVREQIAGSCDEGSPSMERMDSFRRKIIERLVERNIALVYQMSKRCGVVDVDPDEMLSEGSWTLFRAVEGFDVDRGIRFSTYACRSILNSFFSLAKKRRREREILENFLKERHVFTQDAEEPIDGPVFLDRVNEALTDKTVGFTDIECFVIEQRFIAAPLSGPPTLEFIGRAFQLSKERIRQIQSRALSKLRTILTDRSTPGNAKRLAYCIAGTADRRSV